MLETIKGFLREQAGKVSWRSQNLDNRPGDGDFEATGSKLMHGRGWLTFGDGEGRWGGRPPTIHVCWNLRSTFCHLNLIVDDGDRDITVSAALPPVAIWVGAEGLPKSVFELLGVNYDQVKDLPDGCYLMQRRTEISVHHWALWWQLWMPEHMGKSSDPRWRRGVFHLLDAVFGPTKFETKKVVDAEAVLVPMPEKNYRGSVTIERRTSTRPRWPFRFNLSLGEEILFCEDLGYTLKMEDGEEIPFPGKGENAWDCGDDALFSQSGPGGTVEAAIAGAVKSVMRSRRRHGGSIAWKPEPPITGGGGPDGKAAEA